MDLKKKSKMHHLDGVKKALPIYQVLLDIEKNIALSR